MNVAVKALSRLSLLGLTMSVALAGCGTSDSGNTPAAGGGASSATTSTAAAAAADLKVAKSALGSIIVDGKSMTAYVFSKDVADSGKSACQGPCLTAWPPITTTSASPVIDGISATVASIALADGSKQITVNGLPVYTFAKDRAPGDVKGQAVNDVWWVLTSDGAQVKATPTG